MRSDDNGLALLRDLQRQNAELAEAIQWPDEDLDDDEVQRRIDALRRGEDPRPKRGGPPEGQEEAFKIVDIGPYCVECREDTTGQEGRTQTSKRGFEATGGTDENGDPEVIDIVLQGWMCENCQPFESPLVEATYAALVERRFDAQEVRRKMRAIGEEKLWAAFHGDMLDAMEAALELEIR